MRVAFNLARFQIEKYIRDAFFALLVLGRRIYERVVEGKEEKERREPNDIMDCGKCGLKVRG